MDRLKSKVESVMLEDNSRPGGALRVLLHGASHIYGGVVRIRGACYDKGIFEVKRLPCRVISVGNITVGGTGKTPMTIYLAKLMHEMGYRPAVLSRGYMGEAEKPGSVVSDGYNLFADARMAGDEPFMMATQLKGIPVLVGGDRYRSGLRALEEFDPDLLILDDAFQHRRLHRDLDVVLVDARKGFGNGHLLPRGVLREPISGIDRADVIVLTRSPEDSVRKDTVPSQFRHKPIFRADHAPYVAGVYSAVDDIPTNVAGFQGSTDFSFLKQSRVFAFSGIARNEEFRGMLESRVGRLEGFLGFADHHFYSDAELAGILRTAEIHSPDFLVTTEKDFVRVAGRMPGNIPIAAIGVQMIFREGDEGEFIRFFRRKMVSISANA